MNPSRRKQLVLLQAAINRALALDPDGELRLKGLAGKSLRIECTDPVFDILIEIEADRVLLLEPCDKPQSHKVNSHIQGKLSAFIEIASSHDKAAAIINADVRLIGDSQLLIDLQEALRFADFDWEFQLAKYIGDVPAHLLGNFTRTSAEHLSRLSPVFLRHLQEYLQEETKLSPKAEELQSWQQSLTQTRQQLDRIEAKLAQAKASIKALKS